MYCITFVGELLAGDPPTGRGRGYTSPAWVNGMKFICQLNGEVLQNWFYCKKCGKVYNCKLTKGTGVIFQHYKKHLKRPTIKFDRSYLSGLLSRATGLGKRYGEIHWEHFDKHLLPTDFKQ